MEAEPYRFVRFSMTSMTHRTSITPFAGVVLSEHYMNEVIDYDGYIDTGGGG
jgi:hypothetical protein